MAGKRTSDDEPEVEPQPEPAPAPPAPEPGVEPFPDVDPDEALTTGDVEVGDAVLEQDKAAGIGEPVAHVEGRTPRGRASDDA